MSAELVELMSSLRPWTANASFLLMGVVLIIAIRLLWGSRMFSPPYRRRVGWVCLGLTSTSLIFHHHVWGVWGFMLVVGWMLGAIAIAIHHRAHLHHLSSQHPDAGQGAIGQAALDQTALDQHGFKHPPRRVKIIAAAALVMIATPIMGMSSGYSPMIAAGPSMWPAAPKGLSVHWLDTKAYRDRAPVYGDDVDFVVPLIEKRLSTGEIVNNKTPDVSFWPVGRFRKRVWALPGDQLEMDGKKIRLNGQIIADCSDTSRRLASDAWLCAVRWPNGATADIVWGWDNVAWMSWNIHKINPGNVFVMGDNTIESTDSRERGQIEMAWIDGRFNRYGEEKIDTSSWVAWGE